MLVFTWLEICQEKNVRKLRCNANTTHSKLFFFFNFSSAHSLRFVLYFSFFFFDKCQHIYCWPDDWYQLLWPNGKNPSPERKTITDILLIYANKNENGKSYRIFTINSITFSTQLFKIWFFFFPFFSLIAKWRCRIHGMCRHVDRIKFGLYIFFNRISHTFKTWIITNTHSNQYGLGYLQFQCWNFNTPKRKRKKKLIKLTTTNDWWQNQQKKNFSSMVCNQTFNDAGVMFLSAVKVFFCSFKCCAAVVAVSAVAISSFTFN